ncbi:MAG: 3-deoxy-D-manno-octulosonic acid transferase [Nitrospinota bacterium]
MRPAAYALYTAGLYLLSPALAAWYALRARKRRMGFEGMGERLGRAPELPPAGGEGRLWIHAVSMGEMGVAATLAAALRGRRPGLRIVLSTVTDTGRGAAGRIPGAEAVFYLPFDFPFAVRRALARVRPSALALIETELWPNLIRLASGAGLPVAVVNGRLSDRSFRGHARLAAFLGSPAEELSGVAAREEEDARRFRALGARRVIAAGNLKYDAPLPGEGGEGVRAHGFEGEGPVIVAGSTHSGEEAAVGRAVQRMRERHPRLGLLLAPRHLRRVDEAEAALRAEGLDPVRWSAWARGEPAPGRVLILDVMGRLAGAYEGAALAFIGGSLVPHGGQNPIEAARWGVPVVFGPHMGNFAEVAEALAREGGAVRVEGPHALETAFEGWLSDPAARARAGAAARSAVEANQGAAARTADFLLQVMEKRP